MRTLREDLQVPPCMIERGWLRKLVVCVFALPMLLADIALGILLGIIFWYESCSSIWCGYRLRMLTLRLRGNDND